LAIARKLGFLLAILIVALAWSLPAISAEHNAVFDPDTYQEAETAGDVVLTVNRGPSPTAKGSIDWETVNGSANNADFVPNSGTLSFAADQNKATITIAIRDDGAFEGNETFQVRFKEGTESGAITTHGGPATVTIVENDQPPPPPVAPASPTARASPTAAPPPSPSPAPPPTLPPSPSPTPSPTPTVRAAAEDGGGTPWGLIIGLIALFLAAGAGVALWYIRKAQASPAE
jgi:hypothetical protein